MRRLALALIPLFLLACGREPVAPGTDPAPTFAATHTISNEFDFPDTRTVSASCLSEDIVFNGVVHILVTETISDGHYSFHLTGQPQQLYGVGQDTGLPWKATGATTWTINEVLPEEFPYSETFVDRYHLVGPHGSQFWLKEVYKVTVNGVGDVVVEFDDSVVECVYPSGA